MGSNWCPGYNKPGGRTHNPVEIARRLRALDMGFHSNRLEGIIMPEAKLARVKEMIRQGMDLDEIRTTMTKEFRAYAQGK